MIQGPLLQKEENLLGKDLFGPQGTWISEKFSPLCYQRLLLLMQFLLLLDKTISPLLIHSDGLSPAMDFFAKNQSIIRLAR